MLWSFGGECDIACTLAEVFAVPDEVPYTRKSDCLRAKQSTSYKVIAHTVFVTEVFVEDNISGKPAALVVVANCS